MWYTVSVICLVVYLFCSAWFLASSMIQIHLLWHAKRKKNEDLPLRNKSFPRVTIQVPVFNERYVISRLLKRLAQQDYPKELYDVQVLDDSTDDTAQLVDEIANELLLQGIDIQVIRRENRKGYKAGALQAALPVTKGELIAIFDADFIPPTNFLSRMVTYFNDPAIGGVQGRWTHENLNQNTLTLVQSYLLDSHFQLEQQGRDAAGYFLNFNGTAGLWRKKCIESCGGWNGDVLTEDLELSYRAQLQGWKFKYDNEVTVPAELPADIDAFKSQQFRWAKGMAQTAATHLKSVLRSDAVVSKKMHAFFHLLGSISFVAVMGNIILTLPINAARQFIPEFAHLSTLLLCTGITLPLLCLYYYFGTKSSLPRSTFWKFLPVFLIVYMALSIQNSVAVIQGLMRHKSPFVRTPKTHGKADGEEYTRSTWTAINTFECAVCIYVAISMALSVIWHDYLLLLFLTMVFTGQIILLSKAFAEAWKGAQRPALATLR